MQIANLQSTFVNIIILKYIIGIKLTDELLTIKYYFSNSYLVSAFDSFKTSKHFGKNILFLS